LVSGRVRGRAIGGQAAAAPHPIAAGKTLQDGRCRNILTPSQSRYRTKRHLTKSKLRYRSKFTANFRVHIILAMKILLKNTALRLHIDLCLNTLVQKLTEV